MNPEIKTITLFFAYLYAGLIALAITGVVAAALGTFAARIINKIKEIAQ